MSIYYLYYVYTTPSDDQNKQQMRKAAREDTHQNKSK